MCIGPSRNDATTAASSSGAVARNECGAIPIRVSLLEEARELFDDLTKASNSSKLLPNLN